jgi:hypothetical protein
VAADALLKYLWDFEVYCGKSGNPHDDEILDSSAGSKAESSITVDKARSGNGKGFNGRNVVKNLMHNLQGKGHIVTTDNFFKSVPLFLDLLDMGTMATRTLYGNQKYVPLAMFTKNVTKKKKDWMGGL